MKIAESLQQLALEIAATCYDDSTALQIQIGNLRTVTGWWCGAKGMDVESAKETAEVVVGLVLNHVMALQGDTGAVQ